MWEQKPARPFCLFSELEMSKWCRTTSQNCRKLASISNADRDASVRSPDPRKAISHQQSKRRCSLKKKATPRSTGEWLMRWERVLVVRVFAGRCRVVEVARRANRLLTRIRPRKPGGYVP